MAVRPLIRPRPRVPANAAPLPLPESGEALPRVLSRVSDCAGQHAQVSAGTERRQPVASIKATRSTMAQAESDAAESGKSKSERLIEASKPFLPLFWQSRRVIAAASVLAVVATLLIGYQFRPKQQVIVIHPPQQQPNTVAALPASGVSPASVKPATTVFQSLAPARVPANVSATESTSTASLMPRATWPLTSSPAPVQSTKIPAAPMQTAIKPGDTRTSSIRTPSASPVQEPLPRMSPQFPQAAAQAHNSAVVHNPTYNTGPRPLASSFAPRNNLPPQAQSEALYTAARPTPPPMNILPPNDAAQPSIAPPDNTLLPAYPGQQPIQPAEDGSFGAYGGARLEGQIQPFPLRR